MSASKRLLSPSMDASCLTRAMLCALCAALSACVNLMPANMQPGVIPVAGDPSRFAGDTLMVTVVNRSESPSVSDDVFRSAIAGSVRSAFPAAVVLETPTDTASIPPRISVAVTLMRYGPSKPRSRWIGHTEIDVFVHDRRASPGSRFVDQIRTSSESSVFHNGNKTIGDMSRASFDSATMALIRFLGSLDDPNSRDELRSTAEVSELEYARFLGAAGKSSLTGRAFVREGGTDHAAAGQPVTLDPATSSARRWYDRLGMVCGSFDSSVSPDDLFLRTRRTTVTDANGNFRFTQLPPGTYFVRARVLWDAPEPTDGARQIAQQFALLGSTVTLEEGERQHISLTETGNAYLRCRSRMRGLRGRPQSGFRY
ncbi:MAG: hypothetical protein ACSLFE_01895 [Gemmatimonadaceae bacterium]